MSHLGKNVVIVLALFTAGFLVAWLRFVPHRDGSYSDGSRRFDPHASREVRYAVWENPQRLPAELNTNEVEAGPAISPDGRWLVFVGGARGQGSDLFLSEIVGGRPTSPRPLGELNTPGDEWSPRFSEEALYFASDRGGQAYGLDLWRASYEDGTFGPPLRLDDSINSASDDTDPAPVPGTDTLMFASNRRHKGTTDYDLYLAEPSEEEGARAFAVTRIDELSGPFEDREPAFTADGSVLFFASDRGPRGDFDLYSTVRQGTQWLRPRPIVGINGRTTDERAPAPSWDGFSLYFGVDTHGGPEGSGELPSSDIFRARSRELFKAPGPFVGWREFLLLFGLLLLALLAWLAKRWEELDFLWKCLLVSLVVHFILLFWFTEVYPRTQGYDAPGNSDRIRIHSLEGGSLSLAYREERGGSLEVSPEASEEEAERAQLTTPEMAAAVARQSELELESETSLADSAPLRRAELPATAPGAAPREVELPAQDAHETYERMGGAAPSVELDAAAQVELARVQQADSGSEPAHDSSVADAARAESKSAPTPSAIANHARPEQADNPDDALASRRPSGRERDLQKSASDEPEVAVRLPNETVVVQADDGDGNSPDLAPRRARSWDPAQAVNVGDPTLDTSIADAARGGADGAPRPSANAHALRPARMDRADDAPAAGRVDGRRRDVQKSASGEPDLALRRPEESVAVHAEGDAGAPDLAPQPARSWNPAQEPPVQQGPDPARVAAATGLSEEATLPAARSFERSAEPMDRSLPDSPTRGGVTPIATKSGPNLDALPELPRPPADTLDTSDPGTVAQAGGASDEGQAQGLALQAPGRLGSRAPDELGDAPTPERFERGAPRESSAPDFRPLALAEDRARDETAPPGGERWEHTPYKSREGEGKAKALELFGGSAETEEAVARGLAYLARIQRSGGYWGRIRHEHEKYRQVAVGKTGLALLAFLGAGHTAEEDDDYGEVVARAIDFLLSIQDERTGHFGNSSAYSHGIATFALAEYYALTEEQRLRRPIERALRHILSHQSDVDDPRLHGGWAYYFPDDEQIDPWPRASVTAWQVMALESAQLGGIEVPRQAFADARGFLARCWDRRRGAFRYSHDPERLSSRYEVLPGSTPASLFVLSLLGDDITQPPFAEARSFVLDRAPTRYAFDGNDDFVFKGTGNLYFWYYGTLAMFRVGDAAWQEWNESMKTALLPAQEDDGSWRPISVYALQYADDRDNDRTYSTAMCVLTLEIYYRYFTPLLRVE